MDGVLVIEIKSERKISLSLLMTVSSKISTFFESIKETEAKGDQCNLYLRKAALRSAT